MGFFKDIGNSISKTVSAVAKDALPIAAAVATGGTSLAVLKPTNTLDRLDKATGLPVAQLSSLYGPLGALGAMGGGGSAPAAAAPESQQSTLVQPQAQTGTSIYDQITPYLNSFLQASQTKSSDTAPNAAYLAQQPIQQAAPKSNLMIYIGAALALAVGAFFLLRKK